MKTPRIALAGISLESNAFSPMATEQDFRSLSYFSGTDILDAARGAPSTLSREMQSFIAAMDITGPWDAVPLICTASHPWGPVEQAFFDRTVDSICEQLKAAGPVDGVYVANHGAMVATESQDPDGDMLARIRAVVGSDVPIICTLDLHANVSETMVEAATVLVAYLTNPHVDMMERGEEAAMVMRGILGGAIEPHSVFIRMPIVPPSVTLLTHAGPYAELINYGQRRKRELAGAILNVSILGNFAFSDTKYNGIGIVVTGRHALEPAQTLAREIAELCWENRARFDKTLTPISNAVAMATDVSNAPGMPALIFSDSGDNPGGGGGGDTTELLRALLGVETEDVLYGAFFDRPLVAKAIEVGVGNSFEAQFNTDAKTSFGAPLSVSARVVAINHEPIVGRLGIYAGKRIDCHPSCLLEVGEHKIKVVVISNRYQCADPVFFEQFGLDIGKARIVCVKSRGHFRAGFIPWFAPEQVLEIDTAGLTSPVLQRLDWDNLPRPVLPLDAETDWIPPNWS